MDIEEFFKEDLRYFEGKRGKYILTNEEQRSTEQNSYIHAVVFPMIRDHFNDHREEGTRELNIKDAKDWIQNWGYWGYKEVNGETIPKSSSEATTAEMVKGIGKLQIIFAEWGLDIPSPSETDYRRGEEYKPPEDV